MLPVGFMPTASKSGMQLVLCSASFLQTGDQNAPSNARHADLDCPFAHAPGAAPLSVFVITLAMPAPEAEVFPSLAPREVSFGPPRLDRVRGPPSLS